MPKTPTIETSGTHLFFRNETGNAAQHPSAVSTLCYVRNTEKKTSGHVSRVLGNSIRTFMTSFSCSRSRNDAVRALILPPCCFMDHPQLIRPVHIIHPSYLVNVFRVPDRSLGLQIPPFCATEPAPLSFRRSPLTVCVFRFAASNSFVLISSFTAPAAPCSACRIIVGPTPNTSAERILHHDCSG